MRKRGRTVGRERPGGGEELLDAVVLEDMARQRCETPGVQLFGHKKEVLHSVIGKCF